MNEPTRLHLAALLAALRPDWRPAAIGHGLDRLDRSGLPDARCVLAAAACAADPDGQPHDAVRYRVKPIETAAGLPPAAPNPTVNARGIAAARAALDPTPDVTTEETA